MLKMFGSCSEYIWARWKALILPSGESMKTLTLCLPRMAYSAAEPVSPEVAPRMLIASPRLSSTYSNRLPSNCMAMSLKASVGPLDSSCVYEPVFQLGQRRDLRRVAAVARVAIDLGGVGLGDQRLEVGRRNVGDELGEDCVGQVGIRQLAPGIEFGAADLRVVFRQIEAAIRRQAAEEDVAESLGRGVTAGRDIAHGETLKSEKRRFYRVERARRQRGLGLKSL